MGRFSHQAIASRLAEGDVAATTEEKGAALEDVVICSFCKVRGIGFLRRDETNNAGSSEIDILLFNQRHPVGLPFLTDYLIFECKNWAAPVDSATVASFIAKVRAARLELGVLVAANGITGDAEQRTAANDIIRQAFDRDNIKILVVTRAEIEGFRSVDDVIALMREKFGALIMGFAAM
jgi:Restriction endonuclease